MDMCDYRAFAIRISPRTITIINALTDGTVQEGNEEKFFMIYCYGSDHEETEIIDNETYTRTYEPMPGHIDSMIVNTID